MAKKFLIKDLKTNEYVAGPFGRKKILKIYQMVIDHYGGEERYSKVRIDRAPDWDGVKRELEGDPRDISEVVTPPVKEEDPKGYEFKTGTFIERSSAEDLMKKLEITDYEIVETAKGFHANYNDVDA